VGRNHRWLAGVKDGAVVLLGGGVVGQPQELSKA
jgi:hypothetical protein